MYTKEKEKDTGKEGINPRGSLGGENNTNKRKREKTEDEIPHCNERRNQGNASQTNRPTTE